MASALHPPCAELRKRRQIDTRQVLDARPQALDGAKTARPGVMRGSSSYLLLLTAMLWLSGRCWGEARLGRWASRKELHSVRRHNTLLAMQGAKAPAVQAAGTLPLQYPENISSAERQLLGGLGSVVVECPSKLGLAGGWERRALTHMYEAV